MAGYDPAVTLAERILQDIAPDERPGVMALAYRIAGLDGHSSTSSRRTCCGGSGGSWALSDADVAAMRDDALKNLAPERARAP